MKTMKAGKYIIGDCCYVIQDDWDGFCDQFWKDGEDITINGLPVVAYQTLHGDGDYPSNFGFWFPVDSGLIGVMPYELLPEGCLFPEGCLGVDFPEDFECESHADGMLKFGHILINTNFGDEEE